jgi:RNA polymerase sigma factor (TIGR02999 family)
MAANSKNPQGSRIGQPSTTEITGILFRWSQGDEHALDSLTPLVYRDLRRIAARLLRSERAGHTLQPTALVNEAYLKLAGQAKVRWQNRTHFFAVAARAMRHILVDHARGHQAAKRGGGVTVVPLEEELILGPERSVDLLALDQALERLSSIDPRKARVVEMRFFAELNNDQIAEVLQISPNTVMRDWNMARAWLRREIKGGAHNNVEKS